MELIIDTQAFIWFITGSNEISKAAKEAITHPHNTIYLSIASLWEIAIKFKLGKLNINNAPYTSLMEDISENGFMILNINFKHTTQTTLLDMHHRDPRWCGFQGLCISLQGSLHQPNSKKLFFILIFSYLCKK